MKLKKTAADNWFSKCVRMRTNYTCELCNQNYLEDRSGLHCSHYISRAYNSVRYHPLNAFAHCFKCHDRLGGIYSGGNVADFTFHYDSINSKEERELIRRLSHRTFIDHKHHIKPIAKYYRKIHDDMMMARYHGYCGRLEFDFYEGSLELNEFIREIMSDISRSDR